jgi:hypothetical protein
MLFMMSTDFFKEKPQVQWLSQMNLYETATIVEPQLVIYHMGKSICSPNSRYFGKDLPVTRSWLWYTLMQTCR